MAIIRLALILFVIEAIFYALLTVYLRSTKTESLEDEWDRRHPERAGDTEERRAFVRRSMLGYEKTLRARLVGLVLILPMIVIVTIIVFVNYN